MAAKGDGDDVGGGVGPCCHFVDDNDEGCSAINPALV